MVTPWPPGAAPKGAHRALERPPRAAWASAPDPNCPVGPSPPSSHCGEEREDGAGASRSESGLLPRPRGLPLTPGGPHPTPACQEPARRTAS